MIAVDEVGRGPLAGPLVICAVRVHDQDFLHRLNERGLQDSKKMTAKKRKSLIENIKIHSLSHFIYDHQHSIHESHTLIYDHQLFSFCIVQISCQELIQRNQMHQSVMYAMELGVMALQPHQDELIIIDGPHIPSSLKNLNIIGQPKADDLYKEVSLASVLAKEFRDEQMFRLNKKYPEYSFHLHSGYLTKQHQNEINQFGPCPEHRIHYKTFSHEQRI